MLYPPTRVKKMEKGSTQEIIPASIYEELEDLVADNMLVCEAVLDLAACAEFAHYLPERKSEEISH